MKVNRRQTKNKQYLLFKNGYSGMYKEYFPTGKFKLEYFHNNGLINGVYHEVNHHGEYFKQHYVNGLKHGEYISY